MRTSCALGGATSTSSMLSSLPASQATAALQVMVFGPSRVSLGCFFGLRATRGGGKAARSYASDKRACSPFPPCPPLRRHAGGLSQAGLRSSYAGREGNGGRTKNLLRAFCGNPGLVELVEGEHRRGCDEDPIRLYLYDAQKLPARRRPHLETAQSEVGSLPDGDREAGNCHVRCRCWVPPLMPFRAFLGSTRPTVRAGSIEPVWWRGARRYRGIAESLEGGGWSLPSLLSAC